MSDYEDYGALIKILNADDASQHVRRKHRLPAECYTLSDCECFFTLCARHQGTPFTERDLAVAVVESLLWRKQQHHWRLYTLCLMPDHLHFLLSLEPHEPSYINGGARGILPEGILNQVAGFKSFTTTQIWWKQGGNGPLWQRSSYDRVIRYNQSIQHAASYILDNPVRKGLVKQWQNYPYSRIVDRWQEPAAVPALQTNRQNRKRNATAGVPYAVPSGWEMMGRSRTSSPKEA